MHPDLIEYGERIRFQPLDHKQLGSAQPRWEEGVCVGLRMHTGEKHVVTADRICKTRSIRRRIESERWDGDEIAKVTGTPWKPHLYSEDDQLLSKAPAPVIDRHPKNPQRNRELDKALIPRRFAITRKDLVNHGYTPGCPGCYKAATDTKHKQHTAACRERLAKALIEDENEAHRMIEAQEREDAFLENAIREGDTHVENNSAVSPRSDMPDASVPPATPIMPPVAESSTEPRVEAVNAPMSYEDMLSEKQLP